MKNLIPKSLAKQKGLIYKNITWTDVIVATCELAISCGITFGFVFFDWWIRIVIALGIFLILMLFTMIYSTKNDCRFYKLMWYKIRYIVSPKLYHNSKTLNPYQEIKDGFLYTKQPKDGKSHYVAMLNIRGLDISTLNEQESKVKLDQFHIFLINLKKHFSIAKINQKYALGQQIKYLKKEIVKIKELYDDAIISEQDYKTKTSQLNNQIEIINTLDKKLRTKPFQQNFYMMFYDINLEELERTIETSIVELEAIGLIVERISSEDEINVIKNIFNPMENDITNETIDENRLELDNILTFNEVKFNKDHIVIDQKLYLSLLAICDYPTEIDYYWLSFVLLSTNANVIVNAKQISQPTAISLINKAITNTTSNQYNEKKQVQKMELEAINEGFKKMSQDIIRNNQCIFQTNILLLNYDVDYKSLIKTNKQIDKIFASKLIKLNHLKYRQFEGLNSFLPKINDSLTKIIGREIPSITLANGYPFIENSLNDEQGLLLGKNWLNTPIIFDLFKLSPIRKNHNMMILGSPGSGKSYFCKKLINWFNMNNKKVFILDVEREYKHITDVYDGNWIDVGSGTNGIINPLEIIVEPSMNAETNILNHLLVLETFFQILFDEMSNQQLRYLSNLIKNYYFACGYNEVDLAKLTQQQWPIFNDIYDYAISNNNELQFYYDQIDVKYIHELLRSELSNDGKLAFLYNHHSTININQMVACFDLHTLFEKNNRRITQAQLFLSLNYIQNYVKDNQENKEEVVIIIDEAHLLIDENNPVALDFVYQMVKRIRKRNGGIILITQNPDDFMANDNIAKKTKAILNNTQYSLFFNLSPNNIKDVSKMYESYGSGLSEQEKLFIAKAKRGQALFFVSGFDRHQLDIYVSDKEKELF